MENQISVTENTTRLIKEQVDHKIQKWHDIIIKTREQVTSNNTVKYANNVKQTDRLIKTFRTEV